MLGVGPRGVKCARLEGRWSHWAAPIRYREPNSPVSGTREFGPPQSGVKSEVTPQRAGLTHPSPLRVADIVQVGRHREQESGSAFQEGDRSPKSEGRERRA
jgi:hypothetical protein